MSQHDTYVLHIWRSRALAGEQWVARVESLPDGPRLRFADPAALLDHLRVVIYGDPGDRQSTEKGGVGQTSRSTIAPDNR